MTSRADRLLNNASFGATLAVAATVAITLAFVSWPRVANALGLEPAGPAPAYADGTTIDTPADWHAQSPVTLVLFARASCGACQKAQPFLTTLVGDLKGRANVVMVAGRDTLADDAAFGRALGIGDAAIHAAPQGLRVRVTPTLVVVNQQGVILHAWEGVGPPSKQDAITQAVHASLR